jgi:polar amino acid transport system substrate-binding protein
MDCKLESPSVVALLFGALLAACAAIRSEPSADVRQALAPTGKLRVGVYAGSPTSMVRDASGEIRGVSVDLGAELAKRLGVPVERVEFPRLAEVLEGMKSGRVDFTVTNATPARARDLDFTPPILDIELGFLVAPRSSIVAIADVDKPGVRIGVLQGSTSQTALPGVLKYAAVVPAPTLKAATDMLARGELDAYGTNKAILFEMSDALPGSRVLDGRWGVEHLAIAIPKGREHAMAYVRAFAASAIAEGLVSRAAQRAGLRGTMTVN